MVDVGNTAVPFLIGTVEENYFIWIEPTVDFICSEEELVGDPWVYVFVEWGWKSVHEGLGVDVECATGGVILDEVLGSMWNII